MSTEHEQVKPLHRRSDGFVETPDGEFAVVMLVATGQTSDGTKFFNFVPSVNASTVSVSWDRPDHFAIFPEEVARSLISSKYAAVPEDAQLSAYLGDMEDTGEAPVGQTGGGAEDANAPAQAHATPAATLPPAEAQVPTPAVPQPPVAPATPTTGTAQE